MDNQKFRGILLKVQDHLSDNDRKRLHFFFGNDVPRYIRDDPSLGGTLILMESLFDQGKINEQDFTILIKAFNEIQCLDAVKLLQKYMKQMQKYEQKETIECLSSIMPKTVNRLLHDEEEKDKFNVKTNNIYRENTSTFNKNFIDSNKTNINPVILVHNQQTMAPFSSTTKNLLANSPIIQMCLVLFTVVAIIILVILTDFFIHKSSRIDKLEKEMKMKAEEQMNNNKTDQKNKIFNNKINDFEKVEAGTKFGSKDGNPFDDSSKHNFTCSHNLRGMAATRSFFPSDWFQFLYSSSDYPDDIIEGEVHGTRSEKNISERFLLDNDEKIIKVQVVYYSISYYNYGITFITVPAIRGIQLFTTKGRASPSLDHAEGTKVTEQFDGYTVGHVSGNVEYALEQLHFHWYRMVAD